VAVDALSLRHAGKEVVRTRMEQLQALEDAQDAAESAKKPVPEEVTKKEEDEGPRRIKARDRDQRCAACRCEARGLFAASFFVCVAPRTPSTTRRRRHGADVRAHVRQGH
jgi:hypothetical protein